MFSKTFVSLILCAVMFTSTYGDTFDECEGKFQTYVEVKEDCSFYIFCHGEDSFRDSCPEDNPYFLVEEQTCDADRNVCQDRPILIDDNDDDDATTLEEEASTDVSTIGSTSTMSTSVTPNLSTVGSSTSSATATIPTTRTSVGTQSTTSYTALQTMSTLFVTPSSCPPVDNLNKAIFLPHTKSCSDYFLCYRGARIPLHCSHMLHFDVRQQKCDYPQNVKCHLMEVASPREQCLSHTFDVYPHPRNCNYYYQCTLGYLRVMQCPLNMDWHYEKRSCVMRSQAKCYNSVYKST